ncbi:LysE family translocator [Pseudodesulfovibrio sp. zrk46]|uniref:LysE family translocator n=1 Tax=Pseudodesulfovibrio sp. zrk46 TaxID=2725288 RepID=UPI001448E7FA|nr:LysE family translocator [Pseudodesulfovibrio sp. zrk46]QJB55182.1 LysE family translocator [Pseudodesulfovibrio sp. zrk46]
MIDTTQLLLFISASFLLAITPGPDIVYTLTRGITQGRKAALYAAFGFNFGIIFHTAFAAFGLSAILRTSALAYQGIKYAGAAYLIYLGIQTWRHRGETMVAGKGDCLRPMTILKQTVLCNVLNPKVALFFLAFLPQFVDASKGHVAMQMCVLGFIFMLVSYPVFVALACFSGAIGNRLKSNPNIERRLKSVAGSVFVSLGLALALPDNS